MAWPNDGICPHCEVGRGTVGTPCPEAGCANRQYHFIPSLWLEAAKAFAAKKQKPLDALLGRCVERYLLAGRLGEGGMGSVYYALQKPLGREVAVKLISNVQMNERSLARFEREARAISILDHPNIVKLHDYGVGRLEYDIPYMAIEYVRHGRVLRKALAQARRELGGVIPVDVVLTVFRQVLNGLAAAHNEGIVHRDMKPDNIMVASVEGHKYMVKLLDFGLAKAVGGTQGLNLEVSVADTVVGTPHYMAPEQVRKDERREVDARADLYSVAVILFEVFTGQRPHDGQNAFEIVVKKLDPGYDPLAVAAARNLAQPLRDFLRRGLALDPGDRFATAEEMRTALAAALAGTGSTAAMGPVTGDPPSSRERPLTPPSPADESDFAPRASAAEGVIFPDLPEEARPGPEPPLDPMPSWEPVPHPRPGHSWPYLAAWIGGPLVGLAVVAGIYLGVPADSGPDIGAVDDSVLPAATGDARPEENPVRTVETVQLSEVLVAEVRTVRSGFVVETRPPGAVVRVNGQPAGQSPARYEFTLNEGEAPDGRVEITVSAPGFRTATIHADLAEAVREGRVPIEMKRLPGPKPPSEGPVPRL